MAGKTTRRTVLPLTFPCGCRSITWNNWRTAMVLCDGRRVCGCGKVWAIAWVQAGEVPGMPKARKVGRPRTRIETRIEVQRTPVEMPVLR